MFEDLKHKVENQVIEDLTLFTILGFCSIKKKPIPQELLINQITQLGTINEEQVKQSLNRLSENDTILFNNGWDIKTRTKQVDRVAKELKKTLLNKQQNDEVV